MLNGDSCDDLKKMSIPAGLKIFEANENCCDLAKQDPIKYGELVIIGYNGNILTNLNEYTSRRKSKYVLNKRDRANGVKPFKVHNCKSNKEIDEIMKHDVHSVSYTLSRNHTVVVQYVSDDRTDMFQVGRSHESSIDFIVLDTSLHKTVNNENENAKKNSKQPLSNNNNNRKANDEKTTTTSTQSTISRFSFRISVDRYAPYTARLYAAGFDTSKHIFLGEKATKWRNATGELDGVTTNGVLIMHPSNGFTPKSKSTEWMEVSVCGTVFSLDESRTQQRLNNNQNEVTNVLKDGTLVDICGATIMWRSYDGLLKTPTKRFIEMYLESINNSRPQCPVGFKTLVFPSKLAKNTSQEPQSTGNKYDLNGGTSDDRIPMVYLACGHIHGQHDWGKNIDDKRECPLCRKVGPYVKLLIGLESSFYCDNIDEQQFSDLYAFSPCAHMASEHTCQYWSRILIPHGSSQPGSEGLFALCPFCATPLNAEKPFVKLIIQDNIS